MACGWFRRPFSFAEVSMRRFFQDERGATAIEYGLIAAIVIIGLIIGLTAMGSGTDGMYGNIVSKAGAEL
jgi:pilus assembly protein Flp/PilA